jgi:hypothetical protein
MTDEKRAQDLSGSNTLAQVDTRLTYRKLRIHDHILDNESSTHYYKRPIYENRFQNTWSSEQKVVVRGRVIY